MLVNWTDILDGEIVNAAWAVAGMVAKPRTSRRAAADLDTAAWTDTQRLTREALSEVAANSEIPEMSEVAAAELEAALKRHEVQGALQALLAARLTDAPETEAAKAREAVRMALHGTPASGAGYSKQLSEYFDDKISALVATLEGRVGFAGLAQVRAEAYNARIVALLGTITDMLAALSHPDRGGPEEAEFLRRYRRQVRERHGKIEPPDFERRRRVPVADIYVPTRINQELYPERTVASPIRHPPSLNVWHLAGLLDRTVLLGDPGGGKTTAANVLADFFAGDSTGKVPFLITLRDYAAKDPPERSVAGHIEYTLETLYQCPAPDGFVERLLLTDRAVVIFDGLDELTDSSRRADVSARVEQFCAAYPVSQVLVTSRLVGYDQARLDDTQFTSYRLGGFGEDEVGGYTRKWFGLQDGFSGAEAEAEATAFLAESASVPDLRSNPLLLSLMCILYRGAGSLPRDRAEVYEQCANLLFRKWDARRRIHQKLLAGHLVEPAIRYLAWWLFNRENPQIAVTERQLITEAARFLRGRGFEAEEEARAAAVEFVEFCRGRMWVFNEAGTTAHGEKLYAFTHRTFLEYFAAAYLAAVSDSPEDLARELAAHVGNHGWNVVGELAIQIKERNSDRGADRIYEYLLAAHQGSSLPFLIRCLESVQPSPNTIRKLTRASIDFQVDSRMETGSADLLADLITHTGGRHELIADEISNRISVMVASDDTELRSCGLRIALMAGWFRSGDGGFWLRWSKEQAREYAQEILSGAKSDRVLRTMALYRSSIEVADALAMPGGLSALMRAGTWLSVTGGLHTWLLAYPEAVCMSLLYTVPNQRYANELTKIGQYIISHRSLPLVDYPDQHESIMFTNHLLDLQAGNRIPVLGEISFLGFAAIVCLIEEQTQLVEQYNLGPGTGTGSLLYKYLARRGNANDENLPDLPVPDQFRQVFRDWAEGRVNFVGVVDE